MTRSYVHGPSGIPRLEETIGHCLSRSVTTFRDREVLISCHQRLRHTYEELGLGAPIQFLVA